MIALPRDTELMADAEATARPAAEHLIGMVTSAPGARGALYVSGAGDSVYA